MDTTISVSIPTDADGFVSQECPTCLCKFKVVFNEGCDRPIGHCPYCGHSEEGCWWTQEQADYLAGVAGEEFFGPLLDGFAGEINQIGKPGDLFGIKASVKPDPPSARPLESEDLMPVHEFTCCNERIKHEGNTETLICIICGKKS